MRPLFPKELASLLTPEQPEPILKALDALQAEFTVARGQRQGGYLRHPAAVHAYGHFYGLRTAVKTSVLLKELQPKGPRRLLDIGAGTLGASLGALHALPSLEEVVALDRSKPAMAWGAERVRSFRPHVQLRTQAWDALKDRRPFPKADLAIIANVLNEFGDERRADHLVRAALKAVEPKGLVLILEPGTRAASKGLIRLREATKQFVPIAGPCLGARVCPYAKDPRAGWCFSELHGEEPAWYTALRDAAGIQQARLTYSWLAFGPNTRPVERFVRVLSGPMKAGRYLCTHEGRILAQGLHGSPRRGALLDLERQHRAGLKRGRSKS